MAPAAVVAALPGGGTPAETQKAGDGSSPTCAGQQLLLHKVDPPGQQVHRPHRAAALHSRGVGSSTGTAVQDSAKAKLSAEPGSTKPTTIKH